MDNEPGTEPMADRRRPEPHRRTEMDGLHRVARTVAHVRNPFEAVLSVTEETAKLFQATLVAALLLGEGVDGNHLALSYTELRGDAELLYSGQMRDPLGWIESLRGRGFDLVTEDEGAAALPPQWAEHLGPGEVARLLAVPLVAGGTVLGGLLVARGRESPAFDQGDIWLAENIATTVALSVDVSIRAYELDHFFAASLELLCMIDFAGHLHRPNPQWDQVLGYLPQELEGKMFLDLVHPTDRPATAAALTDLSTVGVSANFINRFLASDGSYRSMEWFARPGGDMIYASARDISARTEAERALRESEERYRLIADNVADVIWVYDLALERFLFISPSVERLRGFSVEEAMAQTIEQAVLPSSYPKVVSALRDGLERASTGEFEPEALEVQQPCKDGSVIDTEIIVKLLPGPDRSPAQILGVSRDVTARNAAETALRESRKRLEDLMFVVGDWIWEADPGFRYTQCSEGVRAVLGYEPAEVIGKRPWDFMPPEDAAQMRAYADGRAAAKGGCSEVVNRNLHRDGREVVLTTSCVPILDDAGELAGFRGIDKDITISTQTQESLRRSVVELNALWQIAEAVAGPDDLTASLSLVTRQICDALEARLVLVVTFGEAGEGRHIVASNEADSTWYEELFLERSQQHLPGLARMSGSGEPVVINDVTSGPFPLQIADSMRAHGVSRLLVVPLALQGQTIGSLVVTRDEDGQLFRERDIEFARAAAGSVAAAVVHARLRVEENVSTANQVRDHLARELHDAVTQSVYSASLIAQALPTIWQRSPEDGLNGLSQLQRLVRSALAELRILLYELRPGTIVGVGLDQLLDRLGDSLAGQADVSVKITASIVEPPPLEVKEALYRISQEAFNNIAKHARASQVLATVVCDKHGAYLEVQDDGVGMDVAAVEGDHMGLAIMRERAEEIGASFSIDRIEPAGTRIAVYWMAARDVLPD